MEPGRPQFAFRRFLLLSAVVHGGAFGFCSAMDRRTAPIAFEASPRGLAGDTLEVAEPPLPADAPAPATEEGPGGETASAVRARAGPRAAQAAAARPPMFGAVGVRYATDLATTFTRAFPQAASADAVWGLAAPGDAGSALVTLVLDVDGKIVQSAIGGEPPSALRRGIERTLALIGPRAFTARDPVTKLRVSARVMRDDRHDGLHGDVFALSGGSFAGAVGTAFFALPPGAGQDAGRRVDVELRLLR